MRILLVYYQDRRVMGGALSILETTAEELSKLGHDIDILFVYKRFESIGDNTRFRSLYLNAKSAMDILAILRFVLLLRRGGYSVVHFVDSMNILSIVSCIVHRCTVLHVHGREWGIPLYLFWLSWIKARMSAASIAITYGAKRSLIERGVSPANKISVIPNAVHHRFFDVKRTILTKQARATINNEVILGFGARHEKYKSPEEAIRLLQWLPDNYKLLLAGEGKQTIFLRQIVRSLQLEQRVEFIGTIADMTGFYSAIDYYLFFSQYEPFGLVIAEAMACGVPVVGLRGEGEFFEPEYPLVDSSTALLLPRVDPFLSSDEISSSVELRRLAVEIMTLHTNSIKRAYMIDSARKRVETCFHPARYGRDLEAFYRVICGESSEPSLPHYPNQIMSISSG
jgi:glycosyltransferase involved in cell wall biosynthesis